VKKKLEHGMLLDAKKVMDDVLSDLQALYKMVPEKLHADLEQFITDLNESLAQCDITDNYIGYKD
jgi:polyhydroxyalkanoate synthesis regulator phasin